VNKVSSRQRAEMMFIVYELMVIRGKE
jgi:hypothetical protein